MSWETLLGVAVGAIIITLALDYWKPWRLTEGFLVGPGTNAFVAGYFPRRGDIGFDTEEAGLVKDPRHVMGYADVQALSVNHDFCRMVHPKGTDEDKTKYFACALGGTENLSSTSFRTLSVEKGFKTSRDDYMREIFDDGRAAYCAVVKSPGSQSGGWEPLCYRALETGFDTKTTVDTKPPKDIEDILYFYQGIMFWFRFIDDMKDYALNLTVYRSGEITIDEANVKPLPSQYMTGEDLKTTTLDDRIQVTKGLKFNGFNQFLRLGDSPDMGFGRIISLTTMKGMCFWVFFDEFTNNAHIVDFGNGPGLDNIFVGIIGRGDQGVDDGAVIRPAGCASDATLVLPDKPSGPQPAPVMTPMQLMLTTDANVDEYKCTGAGVLPRNLKALKPPVAEKKREGRATTATLLYEVWSGKQRLQHIKVQKAIPVKKWTHVCITTATGDGVRPALQIWIDGVKVAEDPNGHLPQTNFTTNNYIGKSNWQNSSSKYENKPELFKGSLFDLRGYQEPITEDKLKKTIAWGKPRLGIK
jgi:hypothetical protein